MAQLLCWAQETIGSDVLASSALPEPGFHGKEHLQEVPNWTWSSWGSPPAQSLLPQVGALNLAEMGLPVLQGVLRAVAMVPEVLKQYCMEKRELPEENWGVYSRTAFRTT